MKLLDLFITFIKIGAFSFGGGYAMIPFFEKEIYMHNWSSAGDYTKVIALAQVLPGPFAIDSSAYIGYKVGGIVGSLLASIALSLPSFLALIIITRYYIQFKSNTYLQIAFTGVRPAVIGMLISSAYILGMQSFFTSIQALISMTALKAIILILAGFFILRFTKINPLVYIAIFAVLGIVLF